MKPYYFIVLICCAFSSPVPSFEREVSSVVKETKCPDLFLGGICGNGHCEKLLGENEKNCYEDCLSGWRPYNKQEVCKNKDLVFPQTIEDVQSYVREAKEQNRKIRLAGNGHTTNSMCCSEDTIMQMKSMNKIHGIVEINGQNIVIADAGVFLSDLYSYLDTQGYSIGLTVPGWREMTLAGAIGTASHGSAPWETAVISDSVFGFDIVTSNGELIHINETDSQIEEDLKAFRCSLGLLGVIVKIYFKIQPAFYLYMDFNTSLTNDDLLSKDKPSDLFIGCKYGALHWFPNQDLVVKVCGTPTNPLPDSDTGKYIRNSFICVKGEAVLGYEITEMLQISSCKLSLKQAFEDIRSKQFVHSPYLQQKNEKGIWKPVYNGTGLSWNVISDCGCNVKPWDSGCIQFEFALAVSIENAQKALQFVHEFVKENQLAFPMFGFFLRFSSPQDSTLIGHSVGLGPVMFIDFVEFHVKGENPYAYEAFQLDTMTEMVSQLIALYNVRPHWGKNIDSLFAEPYGPKAFGTNWEKFLSIRKKYDPTGMFTSDMTDSIGFR